MKNLGSQDRSWLHFYINLNYIIAAIVLLFSVVAFLAFQKKSRSKSNSEDQETAQTIRFDAFKI
ncbi:hypothetical protein [Chryseobacterium balustinum]|uniref:hypothetical protein n=1 Tax=Chryseobacterium balustinum TaxID=246 RepID=UPI0030845CD4